MNPEFFWFCVFLLAWNYATKPIARYIRVKVVKFPLYKDVTRERLRREQTRDILFRIPIFLYILLHFSGVFG